MTAQVVGAFDPTPTSGTFNITIPTGWARFYNESIYGLVISLQDGSTFYIPAYSRRTVHVDQSTGKITWTQNLMLQQANGTQVQAHANLNLQGGTASPLTPLVIVEILEESDKPLAHDLDPFGSRSANTGNIIQGSGMNGIFDATISPYNAPRDGIGDATAGIRAAIVAASQYPGGVVWLPPGQYRITNILPFVSIGQGAMLWGAGPKASVIMLDPAINTASGAAVQFAGPGCGMYGVGIAFANQNSATNPAIDAIDVRGAYFRGQDIEVSWINGYAFIGEEVGLGGPPVGGHVSGLHIEHCARGVHLLGIAANGGIGQWFFSDIHPEVIDNGDAFLIEDMNDVEIVNLNGAVAGGAVAGSMVHIKGACSAIFLDNVDLGAIAGSTVSPIISIESNVNGAPSNVSFTNGVAQQGLNAVLGTDGQDIAFNRMRFKFSQGSGVKITASTGNYSFEDCVFASNNQGNGTAYDIELNQGTGQTWVKHCRCETAVGVGVGLVTNPVNDVTHRGSFFSTAFIGTGTTPSTVFAAGGTAQIVRQCQGYNPRGNITAPTIGASPFTTSTSQHDVEIIFTAVNSLTAFKIGGTSVGVLPVAGVPYHVPARQSLELDYSAAAPTWQWYAN